MSAIGSPNGGGPRRPKNSPVYGGWLDPEILEYELARRGLTVEDLGRLSGVHSRTISQARNGHTRMRAETITKLARALLSVEPIAEVDMLLRNPRQGAA